MRLRSRTRLIARARERYKEPDLSIVITAGAKIVREEIKVGFFRARPRNLLQTAKPGKFELNGQAHPYLSRRYNYT